MKRMTGKMRLLTGVLAFALLLSLAALSGYAEGIDTSASDVAVLDSELVSAMASASETDLLPVTIWIDEIDAEQVEAIVLQKVGLNRAAIREMVASGREDELTSEQIDAYIAAERKIYSQLQTAANEAFWNAKTISATEGFLERELFFSAYSPIIVTELTKSEIQSVASMGQVDTIYYSLNFETQEPDIYEPNVYDPESMPPLDAIDAVGAAYVRDTLGYTGKGVKIGQIEPKVPNADDPCLSGASIVFQSGTEGLDNEHATSVASVMVSQSEEYKGVAPDATLYCTVMGDAPLDSEDNPSYTSFYQRTEWLLSQNVNVINISASYIYDMGEYNELSNWIDHIAINHSVHFVSAAGNYGEKTHPGQAFLEEPTSGVAAVAMAYNGIAVGSAARNLSGKADHSRYTQLSTLYANKPDLVAPGENVFNITDEDDLDVGFYGTSYAAPLVTGIVAQILEARPSLKTCQDLMKAILTASISSDVLCYDTTSSDATGFEKNGAGLVNARAAMYTARLGNYTSGYFSADAAAQTSKTYTFTVTEDDTMKRISLAWLKNNQTGSDCTTGEIVEGALANLDMRIFDPNGNEVAYVYSISGNLEILEFEPAVAGTYTVKVTLTGSSSKKTYFGLAWY